MEKEVDIKMIFPIFVFALGLLGVLGYFARKNVTWTNNSKTKGSVGGAFVVFIILAFIGWGLDAYVGWSIVPRFMYAVGGSLQMIAIAFYACFALLSLSMLYSSSKCGMMVA